MCCGLLWSHISTEVDNKVNQLTSKNILNLLDNSSVNAASSLENIYFIGGLLCDFYLCNQSVTPLTEEQTKLHNDSFSRLYFFLNIL